MSKFLQLYVQKCWWNVFVLLVLLWLGLGLILSLFLTLAFSGLYLSMISHKLDGHSSDDDSDGESDS